MDKEKVEKSRVWLEKLNQIVDHLESVEKNRMVGGYLNDEAAYNKTVVVLKELYNFFLKHDASTPLDNLDNRLVYAYKCVVQKIAMDKRGYGENLSDEDYDKISLKEVVNETKLLQFNKDFWADLDEDFDKLFNKNENRNVLK